MEGCGWQKGKMGVYIVYFGCMGHGAHSSFLYSILALNFDFFICHLCLRLTSYRKSLDGKINRGIMM